MGVLREGLLRLSEQGLVRCEPQQGFHVVPLSVADLGDLTDARCEIESLTVRYAIADGDIDWEARVIAAHHRLSRTPQLDAEDPQRMSDKWVTAHARFHHSILDGCHNQRLKDIAGSLRAGAELYRRWSVPLGHDPDRDVVREHAALLAAVLGRDADAAVRQVREHIARTSHNLIVSVSGAPSGELSDVATQGSDRSA